MKQYFSLLRRFALALIVAGFVSACDSNSALQDDTADAEDTIATLSAELTADLSLSVAQQQSMDQTISRFGSGDAQEPGFLWRLAAQLSDDLTDEQKEELFAKAAERANGERPTDGSGQFGDRSGGGPGGPGGMRPGGGHGGPGGPGGVRPDGGQEGPQGGPLADILTDEQKEDIQAIHESHEESIKALAEALRAADEAGREAAREALRAAHDAMRTEIETYLAGSLSADQQAAIDAVKAEREAAREMARAEERAVMAEVLGIGDGTADAIHVIFETFGDAVAAAREASGTDREAFAAAVVAAAEARNASVNTELAGSSVGQDKAYEIYLIHDAIHKRAKRHGKGGRRGGPGSGGPGGGGSTG